MNKNILYIAVLLLSLGIVFAANGDEEALMAEQINQGQQAQQVQQAQQNAPSWTANVVPSCQGPCLEGAAAVWQVQISNTGQVPLTLQQIFLADSSGHIFSMNDLTGQNAQIQPGETGSINLQGLVPPSTRGSTLFYKVGYVVGGNSVLDNNFRRMSVMPLTEVECTSNDFCGNGEVCSNYMCAPYSLFNSSEVPKPDMKKDSTYYTNVLLAVIAVLLLVISLKSFGKKCKPKKQHHE